MIYKISEIVRDVRITIDENNTGEQLIADGDMDTLSLDELIESKIEESARRVTKVAPVELLEEGHLLDDAVFWGGGNSGWVLLPDDFLRLVVFKMSDWERPVYDVITSSAPEYQLQHSRYKGIRGNTQKPVVAIVNRHEGKALEFYSCDSEGAYIQLGQYIPMPKTDEAGGIDISERCYEAVVYKTASLALMSIGESEKAKAMSELSLSILQ